MIRITSECVSYRPNKFISFFFFAKQTKEMAKVCGKCKQELPKDEKMFSSRFYHQVCTQCHEECKQAETKRLVPKRECGKCKQELSSDDKMYTSRFYQKVCETCNKECILEERERFLEKRAPWMASLRCTLAKYNTKNS